LPALNRRVLFSFLESESIAPPPHYLEKCPIMDTVDAVNGQMKLVKQEKWR